MWVGAATMSGLSVGRGCDKVWEINSAQVEAAIRSRLSVGIGCNKVWA